MTGFDSLFEQLTGKLVFPLPLSPFKESFHGRYPLV